MSEDPRLKAFSAAEDIQNLLSDQECVALNVHGKQLMFCDCWAGGLLQSLAQEMVPKDETSQQLPVPLAEGRASGC